MRVELTWPRPATTLSVMGHAAFLALLAIETPRHMAVVRPPVAAVDVVMVAPPESQPAPVLSSAATKASPPAAAAPTSPPARAARPPDSTRVTATEYFSNAVLDDPRNRETRKKLASLGSDERLIQLCNIEAMEQLRRWKEGFASDHIVAYATADPTMTTTSLKAPGAAVYSGGKWYRLSFNCTATASLDGVASFDFALGRPVPRQEWEQDNLPELVDGDATD